jgi:DNA-binding transcriptional ArsR family regulator
MHRCVVLEFEGKSYRLKEAAARLAIQADGSLSGCAAWGNLGWPRVGEFGLAIRAKALDQLNVSRDAASSALKRLEEQGLIRVQRAPGQRPTVEILPVASDVTKPEKTG